MAQPHQTHNSYQFIVNKYVIAFIVSNCIFMAEPHQTNNSYQFIVNKYVMPASIDCV